MLMNEDGTLAENTSGFATGYEKEVKENNRLHVFVAEIDGATKYVFPVYGTGLWGAMYRKNIWTSFSASRTPSWCWCS